MSLVCPEESLYVDDLSVVDELFEEGLEVF